MPNEKRCGWNKALRLFIFVIALSSREGRGGPAPLVTPVYALDRGHEGVNLKSAHLKSLYLCSVVKFIGDPYQKYLMITRKL